MRPFSLLLALLAVSSACSPPTVLEQCAAICAGCCNAQGVCEPGTSDSMCGASGALCSACSSAQICSASGRCENPTSAGGGAGGGAAGGSPGGGSSGGGSAGGTAGGAACVPETNAELCVAAGKACGPHTATDRCGAPRSIVSCATCPAGKSCSVGACVCQPESNATFCSRQGKNCGTVTGADNCGTARSVSCGTCTGVNTCGSATPNVCGCTPETDLQFCTRANRSCGAATGTDNCGRPRTVASCGSCVAPNTCSTAGACSCPSETNAQFCTRLNARCGGVSGTDTCGQPRNVASCGTCSGVSSCGGAGVPNQCGCTPQTDAELCAARGKDCGTLAALTDNCGMTRTPACGTCGGLQTCAGGGVANVCGCTAETNAQLCARVGAACGSVTAPDNCGASRTVMSCGACASPQTCQASNQCQCVPETEAQLCARLGKTCGALTTTDNCGATRTVASCGSCGAGQSCGAATNVCLASTPLPASGVCTTNGFCWDLPRTNYDDLNAVWVEPSGVVWAAGNNGTVVRWDGVAMRGFRHVVATDLTAIWASGSGEVWVGGPDGAVLRFNGTAWEDLSLGGTKDVEAIWGDGLGRVFVAGENDLVRLFSAGQWSTPFHMPGASDDVRALMGWGSGVRVIGTYGQYQWDGVSQTVTAISSVTGWCSYTAQVQVGPTEGWAARFCWSSSSSTDWQQAYKSVGTTVAWATLPNDTMNGRAQFAARSPNEVYLFGGAGRGWRFDGLTWTQAALSTNHNWQVSAGHGSAARAAFVGPNGALFGNAGSGWVSAAADGGLPPNVTAPYRQRVTPISDERAVVFMEQSNFGSTGLPNVRSLSVWSEGAYLGTTTVTSDVAAAWSPDGITAFALLTSPPALWRFNGTSWASVGALPAGGYASMAGSSATDLWLSGTGKMVHYDGVTFTEVPTPYSGTSTALTRLVVVSPTLAWVRASTGQLIKWNGTSWALDPNVTSSVLDQPMWKSPTGAVWALTSTGPMRYASGAWSPVPLPPGHAVGEQVWGTSDSAVNVSTTAGRACTWNGAAWSCSAMPPGFFVNQRVVSTGARTWVFSELTTGSGTYRVMVLRN